MTGVGAGAVGGGVANVASGDSATVPGGYSNLAQGRSSFAAGNAARALHDGAFVWADRQGTIFSPAPYDSTANNQFSVRASGGVRFETPTLEVIGNVTTRVLTITGGADLAEPFPMNEDQIEKGSVVVIDQEVPGHLRLSTTAYDKCVAGIVSGANGIRPGISLQQAGALDQGENVALSGRVYVKADASFGAIKSGDLLTTSDTPGHAKKVSDHAKARSWEPGTTL